MSVASVEMFTRKGKASVNKAYQRVVELCGKEAAAEIFGGLADGLFAGSRCAEWKDKRLVQEAVVAFLAELALPESERREAEQAIPF